ncbi:MAG: esterase [Bdellovibrio sp.]|nr:MAG: esterase [Bdellovibrio sp.]
MSFFANPSLHFISFGPQSSSHGIVLFHGYGANCHDLVPLHQLSHCSKAQWFFPDGPLEVLIGLGLKGKAWFPVDTQAFEQAVAKGQHHLLSQIRPQGFDEALQLAENFVNHLPVKKLILGGFSQGAMLATELSFRMSKKPEALIILSGALVDEPHLSSLLDQPENKKIPFFQSHGQQDPLLSFQEARRLYELLTTKGLKGHFVSFSGGHEIPTQVLEELNTFLKPFCKDISA